MSAQVKETLAEIFFVLSSIAWIVVVCCAIGSVVAACAGCGAPSPKPEIVKFHHRFIVHKNHYEVVTGGDKVSINEGESMKGDSWDRETYLLSCSRGHLHHVTGDDAFEFLSELSDGDRLIINTTDGTVPTNSLVLKEDEEWVDTSEVEEVLFNRQRMKLEKEINRKSDLEMINNVPRWYDGMHTFFLLSAMIAILGGALMYILLHEVKRKIDKEINKPRWKI